MLSIVSRTKERQLECRKRCRAEAQTWQYHSRNGRRTFVVRFWMSDKFRQTDIGRRYTANLNIQSIYRCRHYWIHAISSVLWHWWLGDRQGRHPACGKLWRPWSTVLLLVLPLLLVGSAVTGHNCVCFVWWQKLTEIMSNVHKNKMPISTPTGKISHYWDQKNWNTEILRTLLSPSIKQRIYVGI